MNRIILIIILVVLSFQLYCYSLLNQYYGERLLNYDPRSLAMGSATVAGGNRLFTAFVNPANLVLQPEGISAQAGYKIILNSENRSLPMYNSFDAYSDDAIYVSNTSYYLDPALAVAYHWKMQEYSLSLAAHYRTYADMGAEYEEEVRNNDNSDYDSYPPILAYNSIKGEGGIDAAGVTLSAAYREFLFLGLELVKLGGKNKLIRRLDWSDQAYIMMLGEDVELVDQYSKLNREFDGLSFQAGLGLRIDPRWSVGISFRPKVDLDVSGDFNDVDIEETVFIYFSELDSLNNPVPFDSLTYADFTDPLRFRAGFSYQPRNIMKTFFNCDVEYVKWSDINRLYDDQINYYIGVEHVFRQKTPLRIGFRFETEYGLYDDHGLVFARKITTPTFTAGSGFTFLERFTLDVAFELSNRQYEALDLFPDDVYDYEPLWENYYYLNLEDRGWENPDTVEETFFKVSSSISFNW
ncbi:MAG: hypothetical protein JXB60_01730 [Candidatus Cloacimonetes bacterium]|nr:hypothetical protein [Candidatus Cloacimonadota bacterium]